MTGKRQKQTRSAAEKTKPSFRRRYDELERQRAALIERMGCLHAQAKRHPSFKRAMVLLNETFRSASFAQRLGVLQSARWLIDLIEMSSGLI